MKLKPWVAAAAALAMLGGAAGPGFPVQVSAAEAQRDLEVWIGDAPLSYGDALPYATDDGVVMVPLRATAEQLGMTVAFDADSYEARIVRRSGDIVLPAGSDAAFSGEAAIAFAPASVLADGRLYVPLSFFRSAFGIDSDYDPAERTAVLLPSPDDGTIDSGEAVAAEVLALLLEGEYQRLSDEWFSDELKQAVPVSSLSDIWEGVEASAGAFAGLTDVAVSEDAVSDSTVIEAIASFERLRLRLTISLDGAGRMNGLFFQPAPDNVAAPAEVLEEEVVVGADGDYPLNGTLTLPAAFDGKLPTVVLVHGSGPNDRDETVGAYKPFRDLAWGLASRGIAVLRYDKRTYAYGASMTPEEAARITVSEETVDDAVAAAALLKSDARIDPSRVHIVGHSQGGMLAPRIDAEGGDFAGLVLLAGSPRTLWDIIYDQQTALVEQLDDADPAKAEYKATLEAEYRKAQGIAAMSDEEARAVNVFGLPAYYFKHMDAFDLERYAAELAKPVLVLQGEDDFQVYADKDYDAWQTLFGDAPNVEYRLYEGLNHFFVDYDGPDAGTVNEYSIPGHVSEQVIDDIADWVQRNK